MKFTDKALLALKPRAGRYDVTATGHPGLQLRVFPTGAKAFYYRYQLAGRVRRMKLGDYADGRPVGMTLADAVREHAVARHSVAIGKHPTNSITAQRAANLAAPSVADLVDEFLTRGTPAHQKRPKATRQLLEADVLRAWKDRKAADITTRDVVRMLDEIVDRGAPTVANRVAALVAQMFAFGVSRGTVPTNPAVGIRTPGGEEKARTRYLTEDEIATFWSALDRTKMEPPTRTALRLLLATGQRRGELVHALWANVDLDSKNPTWLVPADDAKNGWDHVVPLPPLAVRLFRELREHAGGSRFVLPSFYATRDDRPIAPEAVSQALIDARPLIGLPHFTVHDLRRTVRTHLASLGVQTHVAERVIGHKQRGVVGVYDRYEYLPEKRAALKLWCEYLEECIAGQTHKVVPMRRPGARA